MKSRRERKKEGGRKKGGGKEEGRRKGRRERETIPFNCFFNDLFSACKSSIS